MRVSVVVPTYNERGNIPALIRETFSVLSDVEIIVVDDDSPDGTWEVVEREREKDERVRLIRRIGKRGLPSAIADGIQAAKGDFVTWLDADFNMPPSFIPVLIDALDAADLAFASRYVSGGSDARDQGFRILASHALNGVAQAVLGSELRDYTTGHVAARREVFQTIKIDPTYHYGEYCIDLLHQARCAGFRIREIPFRCEERRVGETKTAPGMLRFLALGLCYLRAIGLAKVRGRRFKRSGPV